MVTNRRSAYIYDDLGRLVTETEKESGVVISDISYTYDDYNNRETMTVTDGTITNYSYDKNNRLISESKAAGNITYTTRYSYDNNGKQLYKVNEMLKPAEAGDIETCTAFVVGESDDGSVTINEYDGFNQLIKVSTGGVTSISMSEV